MRTTFDFAEGISYATNMPETERDPMRPQVDYKYLVNYLAAELTVSLPN